MRSRVRAPAWSFASNCSPLGRLVSGITSCYRARSQRDAALTNSLRLFAGSFSWIAPTVEADETAGGAHECAATSHVSRALWTVSQRPRLAVACGALDPQLGARALVRHCPRAGVTRDCEVPCARCDLRGPDHP